MRVQKKDKAKAKYISIRPDIEAMAENITGKLHINFSQLVTRLILESHIKLFGAESLIKSAPLKMQKEEIDPLS